MNISSTTALSTPTLKQFIEGWPEFCSQAGITADIDFTALSRHPAVLSRREGFDWIVYRPRGMTNSSALALCKKLFPVYTKGDIGEFSSERPLDQPDIVLCRATVEPDAEWRSKSVSTMICGGTKADLKIPFMDAGERYMLEAFYFWITYRLYGAGAHLDPRGMRTRSPRSRNRDGNVASSGFDGMKFCAELYFLNGHSRNAGGREVIPVTPL